MEWHSIETAPKDGTLVLLYIAPLLGHHNRMFDAAYWDAEQSLFVYDSAPSNNSDETVCGQEWATHWVPLHPPQR